MFYIVFSIKTCQVGGCITKPSLPKISKNIKVRINISMECGSWILWMRNILKFQTFRVFS